MKTRWRRPVDMWSVNLIRVSELTSQVSDHAYDTSRYWPAVCIDCMHAHPIVTTPRLHVSELLTALFLLKHWRTQREGLGPVADSKGSGGYGRPPSGSIFFQKAVFPCKKPIDRCVHLRWMRTGLINCLLPPPPFQNFWIRHWLGVQISPLNLRTFYNCVFAQNYTVQALLLYSITH